MVESGSERGLTHRRPFAGGNGRAIDLTAPEVDADPSSYFGTLRPNGPVQWSEAHRGWVTISHAAALEGFRSPWLSSDRMPVFERAAQKRPPEFAQVVDLLRGWMVFRDPPAHDRLRDPVKRVFTPLRLQRLTPMIEQTTDDLLDRLADEGRGELQALFSRPLPALVIADLLGVPRSDRLEFQTWSDKLAAVVFAAELGAGDVAHVIDAARQFAEYFDALIAERRRRPGDDVISALLDNTAGPGPEGVELVGACTLLLFAGHETTAGLLANATCVLFEHDDARAALTADPTAWPSAVEEFMRVAGPAKVMVRKAAADKTWLGADVRAGDTVYLGLLAANVDPDVFVAPETVDIVRDPNPHLGFGWGLHHCLGAALARLEARIALHRLVERFPNLAPAEPYRWGGGLLGRAVSPLQVSVG